MRVFGITQDIPTTLVNRCCCNHLTTKRLLLLYLIVTGCLQTFWWGIFLFAYNIGHTEAIAGALLITTLFFGASLHMVEARILRNKERKPLYEAYIKRTSAFLPLPKFGSSVKRQ